MKKIIWKPVEGMEASGAWCDGTAVIHGKDYLCDVVTISEWHESESNSVGHTLFACYRLGPWYRPGRKDDNSIVIVVNDDWDPDYIPGYLDLLSRHFD